MLAVQQQPASWPRIWSTEGEIDLQDRLSRLPFYAPSGFGGVAEDIQAILAKGPALLSQAVTIIDKAAPFLPFVLTVVEDPALPQIITRIKTLQALHAKTSSGAVPTASAPPKGIDLKRAVPLLDAAIWYEQHRWAPWAIGAGVVLTLGGIGFGVGRLTKRCRIPKASKAVGRRSRRR